MNISWWTLLEVIMAISYILFAVRYKLNSAGRDSTIFAKQLSAVRIPYSLV